MDRENFIFYASFYEAIKELPKDVQADVYNAIMAYSFEGKEPECTGMAKAIFVMAKPLIDKSTMRYENGKKGGRPKKQEHTENECETEEPNENQNEAKQKPNNNQNETKTKPNENQTETKPKPNTEKTESNKNKNKNKEKEYNISLSIEREWREREIFEFFILENLKIDTAKKETERFCAYYESREWKMNNGSDIDTSQKLIALAKLWEKKTEDTRLGESEFEIMKRMIDYCNENKLIEIKELFFSKLKSIQADETEIGFSFHDLQNCADIIDDYFETHKDDLMKITDNKKIYYFG